MTDGRGRPARAPGLRGWLESVAPARARGTLVVALATDAEVRALNRRFRRRNEPTDVLSFPAEPPALGDLAIATGVVTVVVGSLPFLGLIVPNIVSMFRGDDLRSNLPWVGLLGIGIVTVCDLIGRTIISPFEIPVSVILGIIGAIVFVTLIVRQRRG